MLNSGDLQSRTSEEEAIELYFEVRSGRRDFPHGFWKGAVGKLRAKAILQYVVDSELRIPRPEVPTKLRSALLKKKRLAGMISQAFDNSIHTAILETFPGVCKPWEFAKNPVGYWRGGRGRRRCQKAVRWLVEERLQLHPNDAPRKLRLSHFRENGLSWMLHERGVSIAEAVMDAYPGRFKPWDFHMVPKKFWKGAEGRKNARTATRWLIEEELHLSRDEIPPKIDYKAFKTAGLSGMLTLVYAGSHTKAVMDAYPGRFMPWHFDSVPKGYWRGTEGIENAKSATRWLVEGLGCDLDKFPVGLTSKDFKENGLGGMLYNIYRGSVQEALEDAFPKQDFKAWQFQRVPNRYWEGERGREHAREATRWLIEDRLDLDPMGAPGRLGS